MDANLIGLFIAVVLGIGSFVLSRKLRAKLDAKKRDKQRARTLAGETRQVRRARERKERGD